MSTISPLYTRLIDYTDAEEATLASNLLATSAPTDTSIIFNTTLGKVRIWDGAQFNNAPAMPASSVGTGTANSTTFLRGDGVYATPPTGGSPAWGSISGTLSSQTDLNTALAGKAPTANPTFTGTVSGITASMVGAPSGSGTSTGTNTGDQNLSGLMVKSNNLSDLTSVATAKTNLALTKVDVGLGNVDNTSDANKPVSTAQQTALNLKADLSSPTFTGTPIAPTPVGGTNTTQIATTAFVTNATPNASYRVLLEASASHIAAKVAGTYALSLSQPTAVSGTGTLYPIQLINIVGADYPTVNGVTPKLRVRATIAVNAVAPTGNYTVALYPVTSGGGAAGLKIYTLGVAVTNSATTTVVAPAANSMSSVVSVDFALPTDGVYCLGLVTTATVATSSLVHIMATLQMRN